MPNTRAARKRALEDNDTNIALDDDQDEKRQKHAHSAFRSTLEQYHYTDDAPISPRPLIKPRPCPSPSPTKSPAPPKKPRNRKPTGYAPPSTYAHLPELTDILVPGLIAVFIGTNPGLKTASSGHAYAHPSNLFWKLLHASGCTDRRHPASDDVRLPALYALGNTNIVARPTRDASQLSRAEMVEGAGVLDAKIARCRPEAVCVVGKGIWEAYWRWRHGRGQTKDEFRYGWQEERDRMGRTEGWDGARVFVATSTSGLSAGLRPHEKEAIWKPFGEWVARRRREREEEKIENPVYERGTRKMEVKEEVEVKVES